MTKYLIALDMGTTSCRALLFDLEGRVQAASSRTYPLLTPRPGWVEQDPEVLLAAAEAVVAEVASRAPGGPDQILGLSLSTFMHSLAALDAGGRPLTHLMTWADTRSAAQVDWLRERPDWRDLYARTGCPPHTMYPLCKFLWIRQERPDLMQAAHRWVSIKELLMHRLTGEWALDYNLATGTGMLNMHSLDWDEGALELAGVRREQFAPVVPTTRIFPLTHRGLGLRPGTPVVVGAGDGVLSSLGSGAIEPGVVAAMVGTSGALRACVPEPMVDPQARVWCYYLDKNRWILGGSLNNGGIALRWFRDTFYPGQEGYEAVLAEARQAPLGSGALLFLPYLSGERSPGFNARARGVWFGLGLEHTRAHMARSVLEAVAYRLYSVLGPIEELTGQVAEIRATGGFARSPFWLEIVADVLGREVAVPAETEGSALGAFVLGAVALGVAPDLSWVHRFIRVDQRLYPNPARHRAYDELFAIYQRVNAQLQGEFRALAAIRERGGVGE